MFQVKQINNELELTFRPKNKGIELVSLATSLIMVLILVTGDLSAIVKLTIILLFIAFALWRIIIWGRNRLEWKVICSPEDIKIYQISYFKVMEYLRDWNEISDIRYIEGIKNTLYSEKLAELHITMFEYCQALDSSYGTAPDDGVSQLFLRDKYSGSHGFCQDIELLDAKVIMYEIRNYIEQYVKQSTI